MTADSLPDAHESSDLNSARLELSRRPRFMGKYAGMQVEIDGEPKGKFKLGETMPLDLPAGQHQVKLTHSSLKSEFSVDLKPGSTTSIECWPALSMKCVIWPASKGRSVDVLLNILYLLAAPTSILVYYVWWFSKHSGRGVDFVIDGQELAEVEGAAGDGLREAA